MTVLASDPDVKKSQGNGVPSLIQVWKWSNNNWCKKCCR